jgi:hypothetical protein
MWESLPNKNWLGKTALKYFAGPRDPVQCLENGSHFCYIKYAGEIIVTPQHQRRKNKHIVFGFGTTL